LIVVAEAPGKVILAGEHFVVHGGYAIAAAIDRRIRVELSESDSFKVESDQVQRPLADAGGPRAFSAIAAVVREAMGRTTEMPKIRLKISSELPPGAGLGSSASTMVATAAAVGTYLEKKPGAEEIIHHSMVGEEKVHGKPSGIDVAVSAYGGVIGFQGGKRVETFKLQDSVSLIVVYSGKRRKTRKLIKKVSLMRQSRPVLFSALGNAISSLSRRAALSLSEGRLSELGELFLLNQAALTVIGASSTELDRLIDLSLHLGCYGAKLTGAGGGGCIIAVSDTDETKSIVKHLKSNSYEAFFVELPQQGVRTWTE
jgi:mevalonate kinase